MKAIDIVNDLTPYQQLLTDLQQRELSHLTENGKSITFTSSVTRAYNFITLTLTSLKQDEAILYCKITFMQENERINFKELYCIDPSRTPLLEAFIKNNDIIHLANENQKTNTYNHLVLKYLSIADAIAKKALNCVAGDDYYPGAFSKIELTEACIVLSQVNHMNSRSLNHKEDYSLRDLQFTIPLNDSKIESTQYDSQRIGDMLVYFSDRSSKNNKHCGDALQEAIDHEKLIWKDA